MTKKAFAALMVLMLLLLAAVPGTADFGSAGNMDSPAVLELIPQNTSADRFWSVPSRYAWSYAPLFFKPDEREISEKQGPDATDPVVNTSGGHLKLPCISPYEVHWDSGWDPDKVYVSVWKSEVFDHPDNAEAFLISTSELPNEKIDLMPDCVYRFRAVWELDSPDDEIGEADYYVVTEQMTDAERNAAEARSSKPFSEADLRFLTLTIEGVDCVLGTTTPQDLINAGFYCYIEPDGCVSIITQEDPYGYIYAYTADDRMDSPILSLNAFWAYDVRIEYCGVVWHDEEENPEDEPEDDWADDVEGEPVDDDEPWGIWAAMAPMTDKPFYVEESVEGISSTVITLSNGREVSVSEHSSPVSLSLLPEKGTRSKVRDF